MPREDRFFIVWMILFVGYNLQNLAKSATKILADKNNIRRKYHPTKICDVRCLFLKFNVCLFLNVICLNINLQTMYRLWIGINEKILKGARFFLSGSSLLCEVYLPLRHLANSTGFLVCIIDSRRNWFKNWQILAAR